MALVRDGYLSVSLIPFSAVAEPDPATYGFVKPAPTFDKLHDHRLCEYLYL